MIKFGLQAAVIPILTPYSMINKYYFNKIFMVNIIIFGVKLVIILKKEIAEEKL